MKVDAKAVKALRGKTGAGMMDCKKALVEADGDEKKAIVILREKGLAAAARRAERVAAQGIIDSYIHLGGKIGVLLEVNCETDFVARNEEFREFVRNICLQVAASNPLYIGKEDVSAAELAKEREILRGQALREGKPEKVIERIVEGRINKYYQENCLLEQPYIRDPEQSVGDLLAALIAKIGENIVIRRFARFAVGEETGGDENPAN